MPCNCGKRGVSRTTTSPASGSTVDPTRALFAAAMPRYRVVPRGGGAGKQFSTQSAAEDYARRTGGRVVPT